MLFIYTISISIICVSQEEPSLIAPNQQIYDFYKWVSFEKKRHCGKYIFDISEIFIQSRKELLWVHNTWCKYIFIWVCHSTAPWVCCMSLYVWYQIRVPAKNHMCQTLVNLMPCCIKHTHQGPGTKVARLDMSGFYPSTFVCSRFCPKIQFLYCLLIA